MTTDLITITFASLAVLVAFGSALRFGSLVATLNAPAHTPLEHAERIIRRRYLTGQISAAECAQMLAVLKS